MSLATLAREQALRSAAAAAGAQAEAERRRAAEDTGKDLAPVPPVPPAPVPPGPPRPDGPQMLTRFIPTETITIYVGAMAARDQLASALHAGVWQIYWAGAALTPILQYLLMRRAHRLAAPTEPFRPGLFPFFASLVAFLMWALAVPGNPAADRFSALPALGALMVSTFLSLLEPVPPQARNS